MQEDDETSPTIEPPPMPEMTLIADPPSFEAEPPFIPSEEPPQDSTLPELPTVRTSLIGGGVEDVVQRRTVKPFITSHTESYSPSMPSQLVW